MKPRWWAVLLGMLGVFAGSGCTRSDVYAVTQTDSGNQDEGTAADPCTSPALLAGDTSVQLQVGSLSRSYVLHVPSTHDGTKPAPLILDFHGIGGTGWGELSSSTYPAVTNPEGVVMAFPDGLPGPIGTGWNFGPCCVANVDDFGFVKAMVTNIRETTCIDSNRIYAVGVLTGGGMVYDLACQAADMFASVAPAAFDLVEETVNECNPSRPISEISFRGTADTRVPYAGGQLAGPWHADHVSSAPKRHSKSRAEIDQCTGDPSLADSNGCSSYSSCADGVEVILCTKQGGLAEPGDASIAWPVLKSHPLQ